MHSEAVPALQTPSQTVAALKERAERLNLPYGEIAKRAGVGINAVSRIMNGRSSNTKTIEAMCQAVGEMEAELRTYLGGRAAE